MYYFIKSGLILTLLFLIACSRQPQVRPPNIVLVMADDLGYGDIGCYGNEIIQTPVLDKLAAGGMRFTDFHSNGSVCTPTRAALITGNYPQRAGLEGVIYAALEKRIYGLSQSEKTVAEYFKEAGFATGIFGKWHLGYKLEFNPVNHGFEEFYGYLSGNVDYISHRDGIGLYDWWYKTDTCFEEGYVTDLITDHALEFIVDNKETPFFLFLSHEAPHYPYQNRNSVADRLPGKEFDHHGSEPEKERIYREIVEIMDGNIGRVMQRLEDVDLLDHTFVFFLSDNGATDMGSNGELNGFKGSLWEGGHRVPAIAWYPGMIKAGSMTNTTLVSMDLLPTLLSIAGLSLNNNMDGIDFSETMFGLSPVEERALFWRYKGQQTVRKGDWKFLKLQDEEYLFNLKEDIKETKDLMTVYPEKFKELRDLLYKWEIEMADYVQQTN